MSKLKLKIAWLLGLSIAKLRKFPIFSKMAGCFRLRYPRVWGAAVKRMRPFYWAYQASTLDDSDDALFKDRAAFKEQQWQKKLLHKHAYNSYLISSSVMNNHPVVDPAVILERINRASACHNH